MSHPMTGSTGDNSITAPLKTRTVDFTGKMVRWICILLFLFAAIQLFYGIYLAILPQERFSVQMTQESWWIQPDGDAFSLSSRIPFSVLPAVESELHSPKMAQLSSLFASWLTCLLWGGCFFQVDAVLSCIRTGHTPFTAENSRRVRILGLLQIAAALLPSLLQSMLIWLLASGSFFWQLPLDWIPGLLTLALSCVFAYGSQLQEEYDQTL